MSTKRNYGIDLLRLVLMFMVCILHVLGQGGILQNSAFGTTGHKTYYLLEIISYCAVNGFAVISGYMATEKPQKYSKIVNMWFQVFFYAFVVTLVLTLLGLNKTAWPVVDMIKCAMPVTFSKFWYFTAYFALFFAMPVLNKFLFSIRRDTAQKALIILVAMFSCTGLFADPFRVEYGYSTIWIVVVYCIGVLAKKIHLFEKKKTITLIILWAFSTFVTWGRYVFFGVGRLFSGYMSPTILLNALIMVVLFSRLRPKGKLISKLSPLAFGIYLLQLNQVVWSSILQNSVSFVASENLILGIGYVFAFAACIFIIGLVVEYIRAKLAKIFKIPLLSEKIVEIIDKILSKLSLLLE